MIVVPRSGQGAARRQRGPYPRWQYVVMPELRSRTSTHGRTMAGARALWRATGMTDDDFGKPIVAIANSYTQFVPGDRKSTRLNSSHVEISYAVFCLKKKR